MVNFIEKLFQNNSASRDSQTQQHSPWDQVELSFVQEGSELPLVITPKVPELNLVRWVQQHREAIKAELLSKGGVLFRGFQVRNEADFERVLSLVGGKLQEYSYGSTPRSQVTGKIYTSTEYPANQVIPLHNEMSYSQSWPMTLGFYCVQPARKDGFTPIADSRKVFQRIAPERREKFQTKQVMYVRNYIDGLLDVPWQKVFQTDSKAKLQKICDRLGIKVEWLRDDHLRTAQICQGVATHPITKDPVLFNQAHLFHVSNLPAAVREKLLMLLPPDHLPRNAYYGDGTELEAETLAEIRDAYEQEAVYFAWQKDDVLLLDNMLAAHGRSTFEGSRKILVGMTA